MNDQRRQILAEVASGTISPEEGAARLDVLEAGPEAVAAAPPSRSDARQVRVFSQFGSTEIVGDPSVAFAVAEGPHRARQEGDTMVIEHQLPEGHESFAFGGGGRRIAINGVEWQRRKLTVRMNPDLALIADVQAGNVRVEGVHGPISAEVQAGSCKVDDFRGELHLVVQAGTVSASGRLDHGSSQVRCEMGSVKINLEQGSSVRVTARTTMGKVAIEGEGVGRGPAGQLGREVTIGAGSGTLEVDCTIGTVKVSAE